MTTLALDLLRKLQAVTPAPAWRKLFAFLWQHVFTGSVRRQGCKRDVAPRPRGGAGGSISRHGRVGSVVALLRLRSEDRGPTGCLVERDAAVDARC